MMGFMILLLVIGFPILEIYVMIQVGGRIGLMNTLFALVAAGVLGSGLAKAQGRYIQRGLQENLAQGKMPTNQVIHGLLVFVAGVLFLLPGFVSDVIAILLLLPGSRHLIAAMIRHRLERQFSSGKFSIFTSMGGTGMGGGFAYRGGFGKGSRRPSASASEEDLDFGRDVTPKVIDVTPISSTHRQHGENDPKGSGTPPNA
jgi:UPF0716 protein FxsA